jgi:hypothetical protein
MKTLSLLRPALSLALLMACANQAPEHATGAPISLASTSEALTQGSFYYLRCNATGWGVDDRTRLVAAGKNGVFELTFDVSQRWMVDDFDDCVITETPVKNGWGNWQHDRGTAEMAQKAPLAARVQDLPENTHSFKVSYPALGRYHAVLQLAEGSLSITKAAPVAAGEAVWAGVGNLQRDAQNQLYRSSYWPSPFISRVDAATGYALWTRPEPSDGSFEISCNYGSDVLVREGGFISLLDSATGAARWSSDLNGELSQPNVYPWLRCQQGDDRLLVIYGEPSRVAALRSSDGALLWTYQSQRPYPTMSGWTRDFVVLETYGDTQQYTALDWRTGQVRWQREEALTTSLASDFRTGALYFQADGKVRRVDPATGNDLWQRSTSTQYPWVSFDAGLTFLHDGTHVASLDAAGNTRWQVDAADNTYPALIALNDGSLLFYFADSTRNQTQVSHVRNDGSVQWTRVFADANSWPSSDAQGKVYVRQGNRLSLLDATNGSTRWSFDYVPDDGSSGPGPYLGGLGSVVDSDERSVYVTTYGPGYRYPPMKLWALNVNSGATRWVHAQNSPISFVGSDAGHIFIAIGPYGSSLALVK